jgi:hypothetical protein
LSVRELDPIVTSVERLDQTQESSSVIPANSVDLISNRLDRQAETWVRFDRAVAAS